MGWPLVYARSENDIPNWMKGYCNWANVINVNQLQKVELEVKSLCCLKCEEKIIDAIWKVHGVFDVKTDRAAQRVTVVAIPGACTLKFRSAMLKKARKVDWNAEIIQSGECSPGCDCEKELPKTTIAKAGAQYVVTPQIWNEMTADNSDSESTYTHPAGDPTEITQTVCCYSPDFPSKECTSQGYITNVHYIKHPTCCPWCFEYTNVSCACCGRQYQEYESPIGKHDDTMDSD